MNNFDENISRKLSDAELPVSEGMWASIESQLPEKKERPKVWLLFLLAAFSIPFAIYYSTSGLSEDQTVVVAEVNKALDSPTQVDMDATSTLSEQENSFARKEAKVKGDNQRLSRTTSLATNEDNSSAVENESFNASADNQSIGLQKNALRSGSNSNNSINNNGFFQSNNNNTRGNNQKVAISDIESSDKKIKFLRDPFKKIDIKKSKKGQLKLVETSRINQKIGQLSPFRTIEKKSNQYCKTDEVVRLSAIGERMTPVRMSAAACPTFETNHSGYYVFGEFYTGLPVQSLGAETPEFNELITARNRTEMSSLSNSYTLGIGKNWNSGMLVEVGINYDMIRMSYDPPSGNNMIITEIINAGQVIRIDTTFQDDVLTNKFDLLNIPLAIGYNMHLRDKWGVTVKAGVLLNVLSSNSGTIYDGEESSLTYSSDDIGKSLFKTNLDANYFSSISLTREITSDLSLNLGVRAQFYPSNFSITGYGVEQRYQKYGFNFSLTHRI